MSKTKKKKRLSDIKLNTAKKEPKKLNAFEMHINRRKFNVVGMKLKSEKGLPGVSRSKAIKKRKATLMQEYKWKDKKNIFLDKRIGEKNNAMTAEDKILARFAAERAKHHSKKSVFNLGDGEELTHRGESLIDIEKYDDPKSDDEFDDEEDGKLDADFVGEAHFGGGMFRKVDSESKSRKDVIEKLIAESKKRKAEKQKVREETLDLTEKLDSEWKELLPLITSAKKMQNNEDNDSDVDAKKSKKAITYDMLSKQLKFEAKGKPMDRLKSDEELAKEEKKKLETLEKERLNRMLGENKERGIKHRSADDLDDGFELDDLSNVVLSYDQDGLPNLQNTQNFESNDFSSKISNGKKKDGKDLESEEQDEDEDEDEDENENEDEDEDGDENENEDEDEDEDENKIKNKSKNENEDENGKIEEENDSEDKHGDQDDSEENDSDHFSDLKESDESDEEHQQSADDKTKRRILHINKKNKRKFDQKMGVKEQDDADEAKEKLIKDSEEKPLPYIFEMPNDYETFEKLMTSSDCDTQSVIIERIIKCNHPSLNSVNKDKMDILFTYLLQHLEDSTYEVSLEINCFRILENVSPFLYDLAQWNPESCASAIITVIREKYHNFQKKNKIYPSLDTLIFIKLVSILFSTSDYRHKVATPTLIFMQEMLANCRVASSVDLSVGLFICSLVLEFCSFSKRFVPEVVRFLKGVLRLCHPKESKLPIVQPFRMLDYEIFNLRIFDKSKSYSIEKLGVKELMVKDNSENFKINAISLTMQILSELCEIWGEKNSAILIFEPFINLLQIDNFCDCLNDIVEKVLQKILEIKNKPITRLVFERKRPKPLKLYEPRIEEIYSLKRHKPMGREKQERAKLQHKYKRELKGALREIRRDNSFLTKMKLKETQKSDIERHRKVREILGSVAQQTGEARKLKRKKK